VAITGPYERISPAASYAPWLADPVFNETFEVVRGNTLVSIYRCYELWQLVKESAKLDKGALIEIGVWRGGSGALIAKRAAMEGIREPVYLCDTFAGVVKAGEHDPRYKGGEHADASRADVLEAAAALKLDNIRILTGIFPDETGASIPDRSFRFCHIDVDVYQSAKDSVAWLWPKLVPGGMIVFDDYGFKGCDGIAAFVDEERAKKDRLIFHNLNGHAVMIRLF